MTKKIIALILSTILLITAVSATAFAAEVPATEELSAGNYYEFVVEPDENGMIAIPSSLTSTLVADNTWEFRNHYTGADRIYNCDYIMFSARITDFNGSPVGDTISIDLKDYYSNVQNFIVYADDYWYSFNNVQVNYGDTYYFYYENLTSSIRKIRITMRIYTL